MTHSPHVGGPAFISMPEGRGLSPVSAKTFCIYDAPSPEAIRHAARSNELPVDKITEMRVLDPYFYSYNHNAD